MIRTKHKQGFAQFGEEEYLINARVVYYEDNTVDVEILEIEDWAEGVTVEEEHFTKDQLDDICDMILQA